MTAIPPLTRKPSRSVAAALDQMGPIDAIAEILWRSAGSDEGRSHRAWLKLPPGDGVRTHYRKLARTAIALGAHPPEATT